MGLKWGLFILKTCLVFKVLSVRCRKTKTICFTAQPDTFLASSKNVGKFT